MRSTARPEQPAHRSRSRIGLAALAAGAAAIAVLAVPATAYANPPSTVPTNVGVTGDTGTVTLHADSTAAQVQFQIDSNPALTPVDVVSGTASLPWDSWGYNNGTHTVTAYDCVSSECNATGASQDFSLNNVMTISSPTDNSEVAPSGFALTASAAGGSVRFLVDGVPVGFVTSADSFATTYTGANLPAGAHTVSAIQCNTAETLCAGPTDSVDVTAVRLPPTIASISPNPFSPNGNGVKDKATVSYNLDRSAAVTVEVKSSIGTTIRTVDLGSRTAGAHSWIWDGKKDGGTRAADGTYTVKLTASVDVGGVPVTGSASKSVRLDTTAPSLSSPSAGGVTFYPYPDHYKDTFKPAVTLGEAGTIKLVVKNSAGHTVHTIQAQKSKGRHALTWNGRTSSNKLVPAGKYHWTFSQTDAAGNTRTTDSRTVYVSAKRLVRKTKAVTIDGSAYYKVVRHGPIGGCSSVSPVNSSFDRGGVLVSNECKGSNHVGVMATYHRFKIPGAIKYGGAKLQAYGFTHAGHVPTLIGMIVYNTRHRAWEGAPTAGAVIRSTRKDWRTVGAFPVAEHVDGQHVVRVSFGVINAYGPSDYDMRHLRLVVVYYVLQ